MLRLSNVDGLAVDMLLDTPGLIRRARPGARAIAAPYSQRLAQADAILNLLSVMPNEDPPANLVDRTLSRIETRHWPSSLEVAPDTDLRQQA